METIPPPTEKTNPIRRPGEEERHKGQGLKQGRRSVMNISDIPELQAAAAGFSLGEVVGPAKSHRSRTPQGAPLSAYWPQQS